MQSIGGIKLTIREIDIISCILNSRGTKKIANLLLLSPRTVEGHIQNIMLKLRCNSQDSIIDFVEKSSELKSVKEHYLNLLIKTAFEHQLKRISYLAMKCQASCYISYNNLQDYQKDTLQSLIKHLKIAGIELLVNCSNYDNDTQSIKNPNDNYNLHILSQENIEQIIIDELLKGKQDTIFLIIDNDVDKLTAKKLLHSDIVDFSVKEQYFHNILKILGKLLSDIDYSKFIAEFEQYRINIINAKTDIIPELFSDIQNTKIVTVGDHVSIISKHKRIFVILGGFICLVTLTMLVLKIWEVRLNKALIISDGNTQLKHPAVISGLDTFLSIIKNKDFSANNITKESKQKNYSLMKQLETIIEKTNKQEIQAYFNNAELSSNELMDYLYSLHALSNYYTYNMYDGERARKVLKHAQNLAENYISTRSNVPFNFDKLSKEEVYSELAIIKDMPEIYTRIMYALGRTYIYQGNREEAIKYFELSKHLGNKLGLFEGYLSNISGLEVIKKVKIDIDIKNGNYDQAKAKLLDSINLYKKLKDDTTVYILDYKPGVMISQQIIIPKENIYNQVECGSRIAELYSKLIMTTNDVNKKADYITEIAAQFLGTETSSGILIQSKELLGKKTSSVYNNLGNILLQLYDESTDCKQFNNKIAKELNLTTSNDLEIIEQIFRFAESCSRNTDYTKADSYDGLVRVYQKQIDQKTLQQGEESRLLIKISEFKEKRDYINKELNRKSNL